MATRMTAGICRDVTQGQLNALLFVRMMKVKAARGDRFATGFMVLAEKRQWDALAAMSSLFSDGGTSLSPRDFRYAVPRDILLLSLKICWALLALIVAVASTLCLTAFIGSRPVPIVSKPSNAAPAAPTIDENLTGLLRATDRLAEDKPLVRRRPAMDRPTEAEPLLRPALPIDEESFGPDPTEVTDPDDLDGLLHALAILELGRHEAVSGDSRELLQEMGKSDAEIEALLKVLSETARPRP